jgi:hypothetical protein
VIPVIGSVASGFLTPAVLAVGVPRTMLASETVATGGGFGRKALGDGTGGAGGRGLGADGPICCG